MKCEERGAAERQAALECRRPGREVRQCDVGHESRSESDDHRGKGRDRRIGAGDRTQGQKDFERAPIGKERYQVTDLIGSHRRFVHLHENRGTPVEVIGR